MKEIICQTYGTKEKLVVVINPKLKGEKLKEVQRYLKDCENKGILPTWSHQRFNYLRKYND